MLSGEQSEPNTYVSCRDFGIYICLEKIHVACATYGPGVTHGQGFGAEMSIH